MIPWEWSAVLGTIGVTGLTLAATRPKVGWAFNVLAQVIWVAYGLSTGQWGFVVSSFVFMFAYGRLWRRAYAGGTRRRSPRYRRGGFHGPGQRRRSRADADRPAPLVHEEELRPEAVVRAHGRAAVALSDLQAALAGPAGVQPGAPVEDRLLVGAGTLVAAPGGRGRHRDGD